MSRPVTERIQKLQNGEEGKRGLSCRVAGTSALLRCHTQVEGDWSKT